MIKFKNIQVSECDIIKKFITISKGDVVISGILYKQGKIFKCESLKTKRNSLVQFDLIEIL